MALSSAKPSEIPKDAVIISKERAVAYQWKIINNWEPSSEVWTLRNAPTIAAALSIGSSVYINRYFRNRLRLHTFGQFSTYLPIVALPAILTYITSRLFIQNSIILESTTKCSTCIQLRAAAFQTGFGLLYPLMASPFAALMFATRHYTYRLPSIIERPLDVFRLIFKFTKPILPLLSAICAGQGLIAMSLTYKQQQQYFKMMLKLREIDKKIEQELNL